MCGCLPCLPQFFRHYAPKIKKSFDEKFGGSSKQQQKTPRVSWPKTREARNVRNFELKGADSEYLELRDDARSINV